MKTQLIFQKLIYAFFILFVSCTKHTSEQMNNSIVLSENWTFQMEGDNKIFEAHVPGSVQLDLFNNKKVPQPFYRTNEKKYQWIDEENWIYYNTFQIDTVQLDHSKIFLNFKGLDTYAEVRLNGSVILESDNFFRSYRIDVKKLLRDGSNYLEIKLLSPIKIGLEKLKENGYLLPAVNDQSEVGGLGDKKVSVFTRKAPYHYGWDWGPRFVTMGIWRPVEIDFVNNAELIDVYYQQKSVSAERANILTRVNIATYDYGDYQINVIDEETGKKLSSQSVTADIGEKEVNLSLSIDDPVLWWPNGYGSQHQYRFRINLLKNNKVIDSKVTKAGLRDIQLIREEDNHGKSFYFRVNGVPVFAKGANYIPNDNFLSRVSDKKYQYILKSAAAANMNMIRVWGGGIYENDVFYDLCDEYGLLVWQDFMYACSMYPGDDKFLENARLEAIENVSRLRNHASIALWCGNNEIDAAWCEWKENCGWGWKEKYNQNQRKEIWKAYDTLFHKILPEVIREYNPEADFWPSSPLADWGKPASYESNSGDMHYWGVWHGGEPFEQFEKVIPRFMSEYGFQSFPEFNTIKEFTLPGDWDIQSEVMLAHQRSPIGNQKIKDYMKLYYRVPDDFKDFLYVGQVLQAYGITKAIDAHRINKPVCMGSLYWQLNDCWPGASWSSIDYYGNWKALHYRVKDAFKPTHTAFLQKGNEVDVYIVNDNKDIREGILELRILDFYGKNLYQNQQNILFDFDSSALVMNLNLNEMPEKIDMTKSFIVAELYSNNKLIDKANHFLVLPKELNLPKSNIKYNLKEKSGRYVLELSSDRLEKDVGIFLREINAQFSNNYFDINPGEKMELIISDITADRKITEENIEIKTLNNINNNY